MNLEHTQPDAPASNQQIRETDARLRGGWLISARMAWVVVLILALGLFSASIPYTFTDAHTICVAVDCSNNSYLTPGLARELHQLGLSMDFYAYLITTWSIIREFVYIAIGIIIFWRRSDDRMALLSSFALITFSAAFRGFNPESTLTPFLYALSFVIAFFGNCFFALFFYLFPSGRFAPRWINLLALGWIIYWAINNLLFATILIKPGLDFVIFLGLLVSVVATQVYRYRHVSTPLQRQQTKWIVFGVSLALLGVFTVFTAGNVVPLSIIPVLIVSSFLYIFLLLIPLSIGIAILRYRLWNIDLIINRALVYGLLTVCIIGIYVLVVGYLGALFRTGNSLPVSLLATGLVAVLFHPLQERLQRGANRLLYGQRDEPYTVISRLSHRLEATLSPNTVLLTIVETVAQALKLPYAAILLQDENELTIVASYGNQPAELHTFLLVYQRETIGQLQLAPRSPGEAFTPADVRLLNELTHQVSLVAHSLRLAADLRRSNEHLQAARARLVTTREEERRRLRRDLHDGLGPTLAALALTASTVSDLIQTDPNTALVLANSLQHNIRATVGDIRRLVYDLRPPALDELGLILAVRERATQLNNGTGPATSTRLLVYVEAPEKLPALPAAVEVAAYRIVQEALTNVTRHAQAHTCTIYFSLNDALEIVITDDGIGLPQEHQAGVGLLSMRERAVELGGSCVIEKNNGSGTRVYAVLPIAKE